MPKLLSRLIGSSIIDDTNPAHLRAANKPTVYIVSHRFSYMDIVIAFDVTNQATIVPRTITGVANVPNFAKRAINALLDYASPLIKFVPHNTRDGSTSELLIADLRNGCDVFIWQHPYNAHKSLYHIASAVRPRIVYIDISDNKTHSSLNSNGIWSIFRKTCCSTYRVTSKEIDYNRFFVENSSNIFNEFNVPFWNDCGEN